MKLASRLAFLIFPLLLSGCWFQNPLTPKGSENLNTWLLGEWQHKDKKGAVSRALVTPISGDLYRVQVSTVTKGGRRDYELEAWTSRVGNSVFVTFLNTKNAPNLPAGVHAFAHTQMLDQNTLRVRKIQLDSPADATSFELRKEIRTRLKDGSLYAEGAETDWKRIGEVYWSRDGQTGAFEPLRYQVPKPGEKPGQLGRVIR
jgi:hypothetical protein